MATRAARVVACVTFRECAYIRVIIIREGDPISFGWRRAITDITKEYGRRRTGPMDEGDRGGWRETRGVAESAARATNKSNAASSTFVIGMRADAQVSPSPWVSQVNGQGGAFARGNVRDDSVVIDKVASRVFREVGPGVAHGLHMGDMRMSAEIAFHRGCGSRG